MTAGGTTGLVTPRREVAVAVALCLAGAAVVLLAAGRPWARAVVAESGLPRVPLAPSGRSAGSVAGALGLVGLAGVVALAATRRTGRILTGVVLLLAGLGVAADGVNRAGRPGASLRTAATAAAGVRDPHLAAVSATPWPWVSVGGGLLILAAGFLTVVRGRRWAVLSAKYDAPAARPPAGQPSAPSGREPEVVLWDALDRGDDPTR